MSSIAPDICADFLVEAGEILDQLGEQMVALERAPGDRECLNAVFRGFHTIKGGAGFLGATALVELCHAAEECLGAARNGSANLLPRHFDAAQQSLDWLQAMVDAVEQRSPVPEAPAELVAAFALDEAGAVRGHGHRPALGEAGEHVLVVSSGSCESDSVQAEVTVLDALTGSTRVLTPWVEGDWQQTVTSAAVAR